MRSLVRRLTVTFDDETAKRLELRIRTLYGTTRGGENLYVVAAVRKVLGFVDGHTDELEVEPSAEVMKEVGKKGRIDPALARKQASGKMSKIVK